MCVVTVPEEENNAVSWVHELAQARPRFDVTKSYANVVITLAFECYGEPGRIAILHHGLIEHLRDLSKTVLDEAHPLNTLTNSIHTRRFRARGSTVDLRLLSSSSRTGLDIPALSPCKIAVDSAAEDNEDCATVETRIFCPDRSDSRHFALILLSNLRKGSWIARFSFETKAGIEQLEDGVQVFPIHGPGRVLDGLLWSLPDCDVGQDEWIRKAISGRRDQSGRAETVLPTYDLSVVGEPRHFKYSVMNQMATDVEYPALLSWFNPTMANEKLGTTFFRSYTPESSRFGLVFGAEPLRRHHGLPPPLSVDEIDAVYDNMR